MYSEDCRDKRSIMFECNVTVIGLDWLGRFQPMCFNFSHNIPESWRKMNGHVLVTLLETAVFANIMQIVTANHDGALHLQFLNNARKDASTNAYIAGEGAFLIEVSSIDGLNWIRINKRLIIDH